jgi:hypothetical protein
MHSSDISGISNAMIGTAVSLSGTATGNSEPAGLTQGSEEVYFSRIHAISLCSYHIRRHH